MAGVRVFTSAYAGCSFYISCVFAEAYDPLCARRVLIRPRKISLRLATERLVALLQFCISCPPSCINDGRWCGSPAFTYRYTNSQQ